MSRASRRLLTTLRKRGGATWISKNALLYDTFKTDDAAPITSPRTCEPGPGTLTKNGEQSVFSISGGSLVASAPSPLAAHTLHSSGSVRADGVGGFYLGLVPGAGIARFGPTNDAGSSNDGGWQTNGLTWIRPQTSSTGTVDTGRPGSGPHSVGSVFQGSSVKQLYYDGSRWVLEWVREIGDGTVEFSVYTYSGVITGLADMMVLPLASYNPAWSGDWTGVLASKSSPTNGSTEVMTERVGGFHIKFDMTRQNPSDGANYVRWTNNAGQAAYFGDTSDSGTLRLYDYGAASAIFSSAGAIPDNFDGTLDFYVDENGSFAAFVDGVLKGSGTMSTQGMTAKTFVHTLSGSEAQANFETHPYPALGIATSRVVCPQVSNNSILHSDDGVFEIKNIGLPGAGTTDTVYFRRSDASNYCIFQFSDTGVVSLSDVFEADNDVKISAGAGSLSEGDDVVIVLDVAFGQMFINGVSIGSAADLRITSGTTSWTNFNSGATADHVACFPRDVSSLLPKGCF